MLGLVASFVITFAVAPVVRATLLRQGLVDIPNDRSSHRVPVPRGGGIACVLGVLGAFGLGELLEFDVPWLALLPAALLAGIGYADDTWGLAPLIRLAAQVIGGGLAGLAIGGVDWMAVGAIALPVVVNAVNFMDGINGITALNMAAWGGVAMAVGFARPAPVLVVIGAATAGSALGFLPWNAPKARLFLGDVGSYFFGALVTLGIIAGAHRTPMELILIAPLAIYLADTGYTLLKRAVRRQPLLAAHREHVYQRLVNEAGLPHLSVALGTALLALIITAAWVPGSIPLGLVTTLVVVAAYLSLPSLLNRRGLSVTRQPSGVT